MVQQIIIAVLFIAALLYVGVILYQSFQAKHSCASGCKCGAVDFSQIEKDLGERFPEVKKT